MGGLTITHGVKEPHGEALSKDCLIAKNAHSLFASGVYEKFCFCVPLLLCLCHMEIPAHF